jgi:hypothetical protein
MESEIDAFVFLMDIIDLRTMLFDQSDIKSRNYFSIRETEYTDITYPRVILLPIRFSPKRTLSLYTSTKKAVTKKNQFNPRI